MSDYTLELEIQPPYIGSAYAPQVEVSETSGGHNVAITYDDAESGLTTVDFDVLNGEQGPQGETGATGAAAGFGTVSATVDDSTGTPSVEVTTSGEDTAKNFAFAFHNLKGAQGEPGEVQADGHYPMLHAGLADALAISYGETETFMIRTSDYGGSVEIQSILGNTVVESGELQSVNIEGVKVVGFNQFVDNSTDSPQFEGHYYINDAGSNYSLTALATYNLFRIPAMPNTTYCESALDGTLRARCNKRFLDTDGNFIGGDGNGFNNSFVTFTTPSNCAYIEVCCAVAHTYLCINISDPTRNGTYKPYVEHTREIPASTYFPNGLRSAGSTHDELTSSNAITRIGSRAYQSGDDSDTSVITDGTTTYYALSTPVVVEIDPPLNITYPVEQGGTESIIVPTGATSAAPTFITLYAYDADGIIDKTQSIIAQVESGTASTNYAVNSYLVMRGTLYRVTNAIATGENITPGTNCTATTVMAEIVRLTA